MTQSRPVAAKGQRRHRLAVFIGRFSPAHLGHLAVILLALLVADHVLIAIGSANAPRRFDLLPFTASEREAMIRLMLTAEQNRRVSFVHVEDQGNMPKWTSLIREAANAIEPDNKAITLIGHAKDRTSFYLKAFRGWHSTDVENYKSISATPFRLTYLNKDFDKRYLDPFDTGLDTDAQKFREALHPEVLGWLREFMDTPAYKYLCDEAEDVATTRKKYGDGPFMTGDSIVMHGDHVLMIERGNFPFKGCWAFPGGFVERDERPKDAIFRELTEETGIKVPEQILRQNLIHTELLDSPFRDPRGRVYSLAGLIYLNPTPPATMTDPKEIERYLALPRVVGKDDAKQAKWVPISEVKRETTAFDHFLVLQTMLDKIKKDD